MLVPFFTSTVDRCERLLAQQTKDLCEDRLMYCCRSGKYAINKPVCATMSNGFGKIFDNQCALFFIRCLYPDVCFFKRSFNHPHCKRGKRRSLFSFYLQLPKHLFLATILSGLAFYFGTVHLY